MRSSTVLRSVTDLPVDPSLKGDSALNCRPKAKPFISPQCLAKFTKLLLSANAPLVNPPMSIVTSLM